MHQITQQQFDIQKTICFLCEHLAHLEDEPKPTLLHCIRTWLYLHSKWVDFDVVLAGFLHDMLEDTEVDYDQLEWLYGKQVADLVSANTKDMSLPKEQRTNDIVIRCVTLWIEACCILAAEMRDGLIYYIQVWDQDNLKNKVRKAQLFLEKNIYAHDIIDDLRNTILSI